MDKPNRKTIPTQIDHLSSKRRGRNPSKPSHRTKPTMNKGPFRMSSFRKILRALFLVLLIVWCAIIFSIHTTASESTWMIHTDSLINEENQKDPLATLLIVGGSDGSGTRAFVELLRELGTFIVSEDPDTFDVHASEIHQGWPGLITRIFLPFGRNGFFSIDGTKMSNPGSIPIASSSNDSMKPSTESSLVAHYDWPPQQTDLDNGDFGKHTKRVEADVEKLLIAWTRRYSLQTSVLKQAHSQQYPSMRSKSKAKMTLEALVRNLRVHTKKKLYPDAVAKDVSFAIKAPISMLALPVFVACYSSFRQKRKQPKRRLKFLHVIRDGRDIALSNNQSPVTKFYDLTYPKQIRDHESLQFKFSDPCLQPGKHDRMYAKAMQLWNDWNLVVHRWATKHTLNNRLTRNTKNDDEPIVDYLLVRSEDLLVPGSRNRLDALTAMASFVGSSLTSEELCCLSRQDTKDHGQSHVSNSGANNQSQLRSSKSRRIGTLKTTKMMASSHVHPINTSVFLKDYVTWKSLVLSILLAKKERETPVNYADSVIRRGEELLGIQRSLVMNTTTMNGVPNETDIIDLLQKLKVKSGQIRMNLRRRLLANTLGNMNTTGTKIVNRNETQNLFLQISEHPILMKRYGKWQTILENNTELSEFFHREGAEALQIFGYHPYRRMDYFALYLDDQRKNTTASSNITMWDKRINKNTFGDYENEGYLATPGICDVSIACPQA